VKDGRGVKKQNDREDMVWGPKKQPTGKQKVAALRELVGKEEPKKRPPKYGLKEVDQRK